MPLSTPEVTEMVAMITGKRNQGRFRRQRVRNIEQHAQTVVELHDADTEGGGDAEDGADHRRNIDAVADGPIDPFAKNRVQRRADGETANYNDS